MEKKEEVRIKQGQLESDKIYKDLQQLENKENIYKVDDDMEKQKQKKIQHENGYKFGKFGTNVSLDHEENLKVKKDTIKFVMLHDAANDRYIIVENTYEY